MRIMICGFLVAALACDPGASFRLVDGNGANVSWPAADDSVRATVKASAFTIDFSVDAIVDAPADMTLTLDSASLVIRDAKGIPLPLDHFTSVCNDSTSSATGRSRRCASGYTNLHSTNYDRLDSVSVQVGFATTQGRRVPLVARFARVR
jgi:hypothetical protein